jgi:adenylate cyclase
LAETPNTKLVTFQNMSGDAEQDYFADGMVEDIITALSRFKSFAVVARNSSFVYKGRAVDVRQAAKELGVRYVLEGSVRRAGQCLRITAQLVEASGGGHLWADRFDAPSRTSSTYRTASVKVKSASSNLRSGVT